MSRYEKDYRDTVSERLLAKLDLDTKPGCWLWTKYKNNCGYGTIGVNGKLQLAHRVSWQLHNPTQPIPPGMCVLHECDVRNCVNPEHLKLGTNQDNVQDRVRRGRSAKGLKHGAYTHPERLPRGDRHSRSKLTEDNVRAIFHDQRTQKQIAEEYEVSNQLVSLIRNRKLWKHLTMEIE